MKKYLTVLLCTFIFLFNDVSDANILTKTKELDDKVLVETKIETKNEENETLENESQEIEDSNVIETSTTDEYVEEVNTVSEDYNEPNDTYTESYDTYSINYGTYGRLYVSWFDVALYDYNVYTDSSLSLQEIVDNYDSAAYYESRNRLVIADHSTQGFSVLNSLSEGSTSYIKFADGSSIGYRLIKKETGYNTGPDLVDNADNSFFDMDSDLIMYTCYGDGIMVTLWVMV